MDLKQTNAFVKEELALRIRDKMKKNYAFLNNLSDKEKFESLREIATLISELLSDKDTNEIFLNLANSSGIKENSEDNNLKFETFDMFRNLLIHFPIFDKWEDVFLTKNLLKWNSPRNSMVLNFFEKNKNKKINYIIYTYGLNGEWEPTHKITMNIKELKDEDPVYLKDMITEDDVLWTFGLIDYYLNYAGFNLNPYYGVSI